ncbi:MAG: hypothetical protein CM15mP79_2960 [Methanobacteriota archaeon]|nr:MAG: hypothetical protein CM15mP79_2960 [Euryarchaeota archaeon]
MSEPGQNYAAFNSSALLDFVGDVTDESLKATRLKQFLSVLAGRFFNWAGRKSLFTLHLGIKCCAIEMAASAIPRFDAERFASSSAPRPAKATCCWSRAGVQEVRRPHRPPLGADARAQVLHRVGECAISGGPYFQSYNILEGVDTVIPVDVYIPGCPPRPEALIDGFGLLREKIIRIGGAPDAGRSGEKPLIVGED